ncbi:MAG TPA: M23 family metallopeptidase [Chloroflexia bacterium]|nr:M23 family metallopeptidase [Chloroflexia bacterium]
MSYSRYPMPRRSWLDTWLQSPTYRAVLAGCFAFAVFVAAAAWALHGDDRPRRGRYAIPPGQAYHVRASGEQVAAGGAVLAPVTPVPQHANLVDHAYHITSEFGHYPNGSAHYGLDIDAWTGTVVHAPVNGVVTEVFRGCTQGDQGCGKGWGNHVWFESAETGHYILIAHFQRINDWVAEGITFDAGAPLGESGSTGYSSGPHIHVQVNPDQMGNPGSTNAAWEFPWLHCTEPVLGAEFGAACP